MSEFDGVIFDMDGTLTEPTLDFQAIRAELGIRPEDGILESIEAMDEARREHATRTLRAREMGAARKAVLAPGAGELLRDIRRAALKLALLTRNTRPAMQMVLDRFGLVFDLAWSREDGPIKPEPDGVLRACRTLGIAPQRTVCVGDFHFDVIAANAAGAFSVLLDPAGGKPFTGEARRVIASLAELPEVLGIA